MEKDREKERFSDSFRSSITTWGFKSDSPQSQGLWKRSNKEDCSNSSFENAPVGHACRYGNVEAVFGHNGCARII